MRLPLFVPRIAGPVSSWARSLTIENALEGATIKVCEDGPGKRLVLKAVAGGGLDRLDLLPGTTLTPNARLFALQDLGTEASGWTEPGLAVMVNPAPASYAQTAPLAIRSKIYPCGGAVWIDGSEPGSEVIVSDDSAIQLGQGIAGAGAARITLTNPIPAGFGGVQVLQRAPPGFPPLAGTPGVTAAATLTLPVPAGAALPIPSIGDPQPVGCDAVLVIRGVLDGAKVTIERSDTGIDETAVFDLPSLTVRLSRPLSAAPGSLAVRQAIAPRCEVQPSDARKASYGPTVAPPQPRPSPPCGGASFLHVADVKPGMLVDIDVGGTVYRGQASPTGSDQVFELAPMAPGQPVSVVQSACGLPSAAGTTVVGPLVETAPPKIARALFDCARVVRVTGVTPGSMVRLIANSFGQDKDISAIHWASSDSIAMPVSPFLIAGNFIRAEASGCGAVSVSSETVKVEAGPDVAPVPVLAAVATLRFVIVDAIPGAMVRIYLSPDGSAHPGFEQIGEGCVDPHNNRVPVKRPLVDGEMVYAVQEMCTATSRPGPVFKVVPGEKRFSTGGKTWPVANEPDVPGVVWVLGELLCRVDGLFHFYGTFENTAEASSADILAWTTLPLPGGASFGASVERLLSGTDIDNPNNKILIVGGHLAKDSDQRKLHCGAFRDPLIWLEVLKSTAKFDWRVAISNFPEGSEAEDVEDPDKGDYPHPSA